MYCVQLPSLIPVTARVCSQTLTWPLGIFLSHSQHESDTKFILILDRRLDTWTSVKMTLQRIAVSPFLQLNVDLTHYVGMHVMFPNLKTQEAQSYE